MFRYIHPDAFLTHTFFHRVLSLPNLSPPSSSPKPITEFAVRIGLGDGSGADESDLLIYGVPSPSTAARESTKMRLYVSRIAPPPLPPSPVKRTPRPDDPAPRPHPLAHLTVNNRSNAHRLGLQRKRSDTGDTLSALASACEEAERQRKLGKAPSFTFSGSAGGAGLGVDLLGHRKMVDEDGFLIPGTPTRVSKKMRTSMHAGVVEIGTKAKSVTGREKDKGKVSFMPAKVEKVETIDEESEIETNNKTVSLKYWIGRNCLTESCYRPSRSVPSPRWPTVEFPRPTRRSGNFMDSPRGELDLLLYVLPYFISLPFSGLLFRQVVLIDHVKI